MHGSEGLHTLTQRLIALPASLDTVPEISRALEAIRLDKHARSI